MEASSGATKLDFNNSLFRFPETLNGRGLNNDTSRPQNIQKRKIVVVQKVQNIYKLEPNLGPFNPIKKRLCRNMADRINQS